MGRKTTGLGQQLEDALAELAEANAAHQREQTALARQFDKEQAAAERVRVAQQAVKDAMGAQQRQMEAATRAATGRGASRASGRARTGTGTGAGAPARVSDTHDDQVPATNGTGTWS